MPSPILEPEAFYTIKEIAEYLRLSDRTVLRLFREKALPGFQLHPGGPWHTRGKFVLSYIDWKMGLIPTPFPAEGTMPVRPVVFGSVAVSERSFDLVGSPNKKVG